MIDKYKEEGATKTSTEINLYSLLGELYFKYNELTDQLKEIEMSISQIMEQIKINEDEKSNG